MTNVNVAVCDDEEVALIAITKSLSNVFTKLEAEAEIDSFTQPKALKESLETKRYDLIFLDIDMPQADGIKIGRFVKDKYPTTEIIYVSNRDDLVFETFKVHPFGFVRKKRFLKDLADVVKLWLKTYKAAAKPEMITFRFNNNDIAVAANKIMYIESQGSYQFIYTEEEQEPLRLHESMESLTQNLEPLGFVRIHKGYIVNFLFVRRIDGKAVVLNNGSELPVSRRLVNEIREKYMQFCRKSGFVRLKKSDS